MNSFRLTATSICIILFSFVLFVGGLAPYYLFYIFSFALIIPLIHNIIIFTSIEGTVKVPDGFLYTGDKIEIEYLVKNKSRLSAPYIEIKSNITRLLTGKDMENNILSLGPKAAFTNKDTITLNKRGYYHLGEIDVIIHDVFTFYSFHKRIKSKASLLVYPEIINLSTLKITADNKSGELLTENSLFQDRNNISTFRDYREGDSIKTIHWKLTAKNDTAIVKEFENRVNTNVVIFLDNEASLFKDDVDRRLEDKSVDTALSIINYCLIQNIEVILETQNEGRYIRIEGKEKSDVKPYLEELTRFSGNGVLPIDSLILAQLDTISKGSTIIKISPRLDKTMGAIGIESKLKKLNPLFIAITDIENKTGYINPLIEKRLLQEGIPIHIIDYKTSIKEVLEVHNG
ncbi:MAG: DUF58 domain-containing protein [Tissierella sp.]|nr:DUF58 domain-containing protein [Tissierella sp.]